MTLDNKRWKRWNNDWNAIISVAQSRKWSVKPLVVNPVVDLWDIIAMEERLGFQYPNDFKYVLTNYSGGVHLFWQIREESASVEFKDVSGANHYLWDFDRLKQYDYWLTNNACLDARPFKCLHLNAKTF